MSSPAWMVVGNKAPFNVMAASPELPEFLEFDIQEIVGRSMRMFYGPLTNVAELRKAITESATTPSYSASFMLYTKNGQGRMLTVEIVPAQNNEGEASHCVVTIDHSDWVPKKVAIAEDTRAKLVLKAEKSYPVECVSSQFTQLFGMSSEALVGRTLRPIFGPRTDFKSFDQALVLAKAGKTQNISLWTCKSDASQLLVNITIFPIAEQGAIISFMLVFKGAIDIKASAAPTDGAKCGPPQRRVRPNSMRLAPFPPAGAPDAPQGQPHARQSLGAVKRSNSIEVSQSRVAGILNSGSLEAAPGAAPAGAAGGSVQQDAGSGRHVGGGAEAGQVPAVHATKVREELGRREGGVDGLIKLGQEAVEELAMSGEEEAEARDTDFPSEALPRVESADDDETQAGMPFAEPLKT